jgi:hypothetical protein
LKDSTGAENVPPPPVAIALNAGRFTAKFQNRPLQSISEQLTASTRVGVVLADGLADHLISADLNGVGIEEGLRALFSGYDAFFFYDSSKSVPATLRTVWIYAKGSAGSMRPVPPGDWAGVKELEASLANADAQTRESAYEALLERPDHRSRRLVIDALTGTREQDVPLRQRLLSNALSKGFPVPEDVLGDLARTDRSEQIRWVALDALAERPSAKQVAEAAITDASEVVRARAKEILTQGNQAQTNQAQTNQETQRESLRQTPDGGRP